MKAAKELVAHLQSTHPVIVKNISLLCEAYIDLAYHDVSVYRTEKSMLLNIISAYLVMLCCLT